MRTPRLVAVLLAATLPSCSGPPRPTYDGPERPLSEVSVLRDSHHAMIWAIDDQEVSGTIWALLPGSHDVHMRVRLVTNAPNMFWTIWSFCSARIQAAPGGEYQSRAELRKEVASGLAEKVEMHVGVFDAEGALVAVAHDCSDERPHIAD